MKKSMITLMTIVLPLVLASQPAQADVRKNVCEDRDRDGRFGIVEYTVRQPAVKPAVIQANVGTYESCMNRKSRINSCKGSNLCTCEDWDRDGRFGVVKNKFAKINAVVLRPNVGSYYNCIALKSANSTMKDTAARYHACEDRDRDGRFGVVRYNLQEKLGEATVISPNFGNYYSCISKKNSLAACGGNKLCTCEDWNRDGRFGVVKYPGVKVGQRVTRSNIGTYAQCKARL